MYPRPSFIYDSMYFFIVLIVMGCTGSSIHHSTIDKTSANKIDVNKNVNEYAQMINHSVGGRSFNWRFSCNGGDCVIGQFIGGDYWIAPKSEDEKVIIHSVSPEGEENGMMSNPGRAPEQGFLKCDAKVLKFYNPSLNLMNSLPKVVKTETSLIKAAKRSDEMACWGKNNQHHCCVDAYDVVTVLKKPLTNASQYFRPGFAGSDKKLYQLNDFDLKKIPHIKEVAKYPKRPLFDETGKRWHSPYVDHYMSFMGDTGRAFAPNNIIPNYGAEQNRLYLDDLINVFGPESIDLKIPAITGLIQRGLDLYASMETGVVWPSGAGQQIGRKPPIVFFATVVNDDVIKKRVKEMADLPIKVTQEDGQVRVVSNSDGGAGVPVWGDFKTGGCTEDGYWTQLFHAQQYAGGAKQKIKAGDNKRTCGDPYGWIDGPAGLPGSAYMACCSTGGYIEYVLTQFLMPSLCEAANDPKLINYVNRVVNQGILTQPDICAPPDLNESAECNPYKTSNSGCLYYKKTWGPDPLHPGQCIQNADGQHGRYPTLNGNKISRIDNEGKLSVFMRKSLDLQQIPACNTNRL